MSEIVAQLIRLNSMVSDVAGILVMIMCLLGCLVLIKPFK